MFFHPAYLQKLDWFAYGDFKFGSLVTITYNEGRNHRQEASEYSSTKGKKKMKQKGDT